MAQESQAIHYKACQTLYYAIHEQANRIGLPLTHWVTINFSSTGIEPQNAVPIFQIIRKNYFNKWALRPRKNGGQAFQPTFAYVFENARDDVVFEKIGDGLPHNVHVHFALHIPADRVFDFEQRIWEWLDKHCSGNSASNAILIKEIDEADGGTKGIRTYALKGGDDKSAAWFGTKAKPQGAILGRRSGVSRNLGPTARREMDRAMGIRRRRVAA